MSGIQSIDAAGTASPPQEASEMRTAIVVASVHHGNTMKIARAMAEILNAEVLSVTDTSADQLRAFDLFGFGSGIYFGRHHGSLRALVSSLTRAPQSAFVFSTAGLPFLHRLFHWPLRRRLNRLGCRIIGEFSCRGWDTVGPLWLLGGINRRHPNQRDEARARQFAQRIAGAVEIANKGS